MQEIIESLPEQGKRGGHNAENQSKVTRYLLNKWQNAAKPDNLRAPLERRLNAVLDRMIADNAEGALPWLVRMFALPGVADFVAKEVVEAWKQELEGAGLRT